MLVRNAPMDWTRCNRTLVGTASCWRTPSLDGVLLIWVLFSRSHASQPPLSMPPTPPPAAAAGSRLAVDIGIVLVRHRAAIAAA